MNKLCCFLTGGHEYEDSNLRASEDWKKGNIVYRNFCVKCGKSYCFNVSISAILTDEMRQQIIEALQLYNNSKEANNDE